MAIWRVAHKLDMKVKVCVICYKHAKFCFHVRHQ